MKKKLFIFLFCTFTAASSGNFSSLMSGTEKPIGRDVKTESDFQIEDNSQYQKLARDIFKELIEINTTSGYGSTKAAEAMAARLKSAGFPDRDILVTGPDEQHKNLVFCFRGEGKLKPVLFICHLDVVEALRQDWSVDPFAFLEKDGYFYGRGTTDIKNDDAALITDVIRLKKEGYIPNRDIIIALTADEEMGNANGVNWLVTNQRDLIDAEFCINPDTAAARRLSASSAYYNAMMRTTCVATMMNAGHAENALPNTAQTIINCRMLPDDNPDNVTSVLKSVLADSLISVTRTYASFTAPLSPLRNDFTDPVNQISASMWPGVNVSPIMSTGATDGRYLRRMGIPVYGVSGMFGDMDDIRAHGKDERIGVKEFYNGVEFMYRFIKALSSEK